MRNNNNIFNTCKECPFFKFEDAYGNGECGILAKESNSTDTCYFFWNKEDMNNKIAEKIIHYEQKWRRGGKGKMVSGFLLGIAIDQALRCMRKERRMVDSVNEGR